MTDDAPAARHLIVHGHVQGVFYRDWTVASARGFGLAGWVRNLPDGTVEAHLEGDPDAIEQMIAALHDGPPRAAPGRIEQQAAQVEGLGAFSRR